MRCPKCQYISFDNSDRCRNCGYEFVLAVDVKSLDLPIQTGDEPIGPLSDFRLSEGSSATDSPAPTASAESAPAASGAISQRPITSSFDLPLFRDRGAGDAPLVTPPAVPRPPLSVRRSNPTGSRTPVRPQLEEPELDLESPAPFEPQKHARAIEPTPVPPVATERDEVLPKAAPAGSRLLAAIVDAVILGAISGVVLYLTLRICGLSFNGVSLIPLAPFASFLLLIAGGYFTLFVAASGQTIGKMAAGLKVVPADSDAPRVSLGHAVLRAAAYFVSALPAGLGFLPALLGADRRAIHDRLAATRVVKA
jgi:uncharacterized RDD family membrane protein YckC